jgi:long-chain acyl-CoA synthetase
VCGGTRSPPPPQKNPSSRQNPKQPAALKALGKELGVASDDMSALCANADVTKKVLADLQAACKKAKLASFETPTKLILVADEWSVENDLLTSTLKTKRKQIADKHAAEIKAIYT